MKKLLLLAAAVGALALTATATPINCGTAVFSGGNGGPTTLTCTGQSAPLGFQIIGITLSYQADFSQGFSATNTVQMTFTPGSSPAGIGGFTPSTTDLFPTCSGGSPSLACSTGGVSTSSASASGGPQTSVASFGVNVSSLVTSGSVGASTGTVFYDIITVSDGTIPEPMSMSLMGAGLLGLGILGRRKFARK